MNELKNKIALVTGGTTGIGLATAQRFAREGAKVIVTGRNPDTLRAAEDALGPDVDVWSSDAADDDAVAALMHRVRETHGRIDVLFLNAGVARFAPIGDAPVEDFDAMWRLNVRSPWLTLQRALPLLSEGASVIVNTSALDEMGLAGASGYSATKAALRSIVRTAATELAARGIRVNAIAPGPIETPIYDKLGLPGEAVEAMSQQLIEKVPLSRFGRSEEVAASALFLAGANSSYVTGAELAVDGGLAQV